MSLFVQVVVYSPSGQVLRKYTIDYDDPVQRRVLGEQCRNAFEAGQSIRTTPLGESNPHEVMRRRAALARCRGAA